jgi:4-alpha-glucanotransferase
LELNYNYLLRSSARKNWKRIGIKRRSGVVVPLFSVYSKRSAGTGEIPDLKLVVDWCIKSGISIIQLLPMNELGYDSSPYNSISTFALEPMYLRLGDLKSVDLRPFENKFKKLKQKFSYSRAKTDYSIKNSKLELLKDIFKKADLNNTEFIRFIRKNNYWLFDFAAYKVLKEKNKFKSWENWYKHEVNYSRKLRNDVLKKYKRKILFYYWVQWQLYEQMKEARAYANKNGVYIMGDLPFLISRDSADIWSHRKYFNLHLSSGAPPDMYFAFGQNWGSPTYNWNNIAKDKFTYLKKRIRYAENFYDMYRIDHFVGLFRIWSVDMRASAGGHEAMSGKFVPENKNRWESHGKKIIREMLKSSHMLPCAEDLGTVPACSYKTLKEYGIPGIDFQRFYRRPRKNFEFVKPGEYRKNSSAVISTHDSSFFPQWWNYEAGTIDKALFEYLCNQNNIKGQNFKNIIYKLFDKKHSNKRRLFWKKNIRDANILLKILNLKESRAKKIIRMYHESYREKNKFMNCLYGMNKNPKNSSSALQKKCIEKINESASIFSIQLIQEYLFLDNFLFKKTNRADYRINMPGIMNELNWSLRLPISLENIMKRKKLISLLMRIFKNTNRV